MNFLYFHSIIFFFIIILINSNICLLQFPQNCGINGKNSSQLNWKIVGGQKAERGEWPWQVLIIRDISIAGIHIPSPCGGTIINEQWILTAAHCLNNDTNPDSYTVRLGEFTISETNSNTRILANVEKVISHELWNYVYARNDIALLKLNFSIDFADRHKHLQPICLPTFDTNVTETCFVTGWGELNKNGPMSDTLMKVEAPIFDIENCSRILSPINETTNLCAGGSTSGGFGACGGDSGSPVQCVSDDGIWYQMGVLSWGIPCANPGRPDVFTRVAAFRSWIQETISQN